MENLADWTPSEPKIKAGDTVTIKVRRQRKWWQLWKPRTWTEISTWRATRIAGTNGDSR